MAVVEVRAESFGQRLLESVAQGRVPFAGAMELTYRCPLRCSHCFNRLPAGDAAGQRELSLAEHRGLLDQLAAAGCLTLLLTGGEVLLRRDFLEIYLHAKRLGFCLTVFTNGTLITDEIAGCLGQWPPLAVEITLYGASAETYAEVTGNAAGLQRCLAGLDRLLDAGVRVRLKALATRQTFRDLPAMRAIAAERGLPLRHDPLLNGPLHDGLDREGPFAQRLKPEQVVALDEQQPERIAGIENLLARGREAPTSELLYECGGGQRYFAIDPYGGLGLCLLSRAADRIDVVRGERSFAQGWEALGQLRRRVLARRTDCVGCELKPLCGQCPAVATLESGDPETPVNYYCEVAHLRAARFSAPGVDDSEAGTLDENV